MKIKSEYKEWCYSLFDDGFWYSLTCWGTLTTPEDTYLESEEDAKKVLEAIGILKKYEKACLERAKEYENDEDG